MTQMTKEKTKQTETTTVEPINIVCVGDIELRSNQPIDVLVSFIVGMLENKQIQSYVNSIKQERSANTRSFYG